MSLVVNIFNFRIINFWILLRYLKIKRFLLPSELNWLFIRPHTIKLQKEREREGGAISSKLKYTHYLQQRAGFRECCKFDLGGIRPPFRRCSLPARYPRSARPRLPLKMKIVFKAKLSLNLEIQNQIIQFRPFSIKIKFFLSNKWNKQWIVSRSKIITW